MDPQLLAALQKYYDSSPNFASEYNRIRAQGETRSPLEWLYDHIQSSPQDQDKFVNMYNGNGTGASDPNYDPTKTGTTDQTGTTLPLEQDLLDKILNGYVYPDMADDATRRGQADDIARRVNSGIDTALAVNNDSLNGNRLQDEYTQAGDTRTRLTGATTTQAESLRAALATLDKQRRDALDPLMAARTASAETAGAAVNQGLESERDRLTAQQALQGFYGGSSSDDAAQLRATIAARQGAAGLVGQANVANATDLRGLGDDTAKTGFDISGQEASGIKDATDFETKMRQGYFDNDYTRRLDAALRVPQLESSRFNALTAADSYRNNGVNRALGLLGWFSGSSAPPNVSPYFTPADNSGQDLAGLGTGIVSGAIGVGNANNWWKTPTTGSTLNGIPVVNTPSNPSTTNWW